MSWSWNSSAQVAVVVSLGAVFGGVSSYSTSGSSGPMSMVVLAILILPKSVEPSTMYPFSPSPVTFSTVPPVFFQRWTVLRSENCSDTGTSWLNPKMQGDFQPTLEMIA